MSELEKPFESYAESSRSCPSAGGHPETMKMVADILSSKWLGPKSWVVRVKIVWPKNTSDCIQTLLYSAVA